MTPSPLDPIAEFMLLAYNETAIGSRAFRDKWGQPPTLMAKVHDLLSIMQALLNQDDRYSLGQEYSEYGRVQLTDLATSETYVLRSDAAVSIERRQRQNTALFDSARYLKTDTTLLIHKFHETGLDLAVAGARHLEGKRHLEATGSPTHIGTWLLATPPTTRPFDQGSDDAFDELGSMDNLGESGAS